MVADCSVKQWRKIFAGQGCPFLDVSVKLQYLESLLPDQGNNPSL